MTVPDENSRNDYFGNGSAVDFAYEFKIFDAADLLVILTDIDGTQHIQTLNVDYTVDGVLLPGGGDVTFTTAPTGDGGDGTSQKVAILRVLEFIQEMDLKNGQAFLAEVLERAVDRLCMLAQQLNEQASRTLRIPESEAGGADFILPLAAERAGHTQSYDSQGRPVVGDEISGATVSAAMVPVVEAATLALAREAMGSKIGTDVQAFSAVLAALAALTPAAYKGIVFSGVSSAATFDLSSLAIALSALNTEGDWRAGIGCGDIATIDLSTNAGEYLDGQGNWIALATTFAPQLLTSSGTATVVNGGVYEALLVGGGSGGGSGENPGPGAKGGGMGNPGNRATVRFTASGTSLSYACGAGGTGGAAKGVGSSGSNNGAAGGNTTLGTFTASGGVAGIGGDSATGAGQSAVDSGGAGGAAGSGGDPNGSPGGNAVAGSACGGGGGGGTLNTDWGSSAGGNGDAGFIILTRIS